MRISKVAVAALALSVVFLSIAIYVFASYGPKIADMLRSIDIGPIEVPEYVSSLIGSISRTIPERPDPDAMPDDMQRYYELKNVSCATLGGDFLIVTDDVSRGSFEGIVPDIPEERDAASLILSRFDFNQTTKTYLRGEWMKKVVMDGSGQTTTVWKDGRIYNCDPECTMRIFTKEDSESYYSMLESMRRGCAHFGRTQLPESIDVKQLIRVEHVGPKDIGGFRCQGFLISGNSTYAAAMLSSHNLTEEQEALLWGVSRLKGPLEECLDEATGVIVYRKLTMDLSDIYKFDYAPGGYMEVEQQTTLTYFTDNVPESFLALPG